MTATNTFNEHDEFTENVRLRLSNKNMPDNQVAQMMNIKKVGISHVESSDSMMCNGYCQANSIGLNISLIDDHGLY